MKRTKRALSLNREMIRTLTSEQLERANGGIVKTDAGGPCSATFVLCGGGTSIYDSSYCSADPAC
jgi:hypothetical protein